MLRFVREASAPAALNHPNIAHIHEIMRPLGANLSQWSFISDGQ